MNLSRLTTKFKITRGAGVTRMIRSGGQQIASSVNSVHQKFLQRNDQEVALIKTLGGPRVGKINPELKLPTLMESNLASLEKKLQSLGIFYWKFGLRCSETTVINLLEEDYAKFVQGLEADEDFSDWYFRGLNMNKEFNTKEELISSMSRKAPPIGFRAFRFVSAGENSDFVGGLSQGVEVVRWIRDDLRQRIISEVWNPYSTELPCPQMSDSAWASSLQLAQSDLGHDVNFAMDAVITWVNGKDKEWNQRKNQALGVSSSELIKDAADIARFESLDELRYCLRSIEQYAPWIRKIFIVTDRQTPSWLRTDEASKVQIVDHSEIWSDPVDLPVFNSHAIEANLHRIPGLSEHFLYFNDDMLLTKPVTPGHFFHPNGISKVFYSRALVDFLPVSEGDNVSTVAAKNARQILTEDKFSAMNRKYFHTPYALRVSVMSEMEERYPEIFAVTSKAKFRSTSDAALAGSFYFNYALGTGRAVPGRIKYDYIDPADPASIAKLRRISKLRNVEVVVVNDGSQEASESKRNEIRRLVPKLLNALLPVKSVFEK